MKNWRPDDWTNPCEVVITSGTDVGGRQRLINEGASKVYEAGADAMLKKVYEWGDELCDMHQETKYKRQCGYCWQALLKEIR